MSSPETDRRRKLESQLAAATDALYKHREVLRRERVGDLDFSLAECDRLLKAIPVLEASLTLAKDAEEKSRA